MEEEEEEEEYEEESFQEESPQKATKRQPSNKKASVAKVWGDPVCTLTSPFLGALLLLA